MPWVRATHSQARPLQCSLTRPSPGHIAFAPQGLDPLAGTPVLPRGTPMWLPHKASMAPVPFSSTSQLCSHETAPEQTVWLPMRPQQDRLGGTGTDLRPCAPSLGKLLRRLSGRLPCYPNALDSGPGVAPSSVNKLPLQIVNAGGDEYISSPQIISHASPDTQLGVGR